GIRDFHVTGVQTCALPILFLNKIDNFETPVRDILPMLQPASAKPLVLRQIPVWENGIATGFVDLALERAFVYREHAPSEVIAVRSEERRVGKGWRARGWP